MDSRHWQNSRSKRRELVEAIGYDRIVKTVIRDYDHPKGPTEHRITNTGLILIYNHRTKLFITALIARPGQIRRYYREDEEIPEEVMTNARIHQRKGYYNDD